MRFFRAVSLALPILEVQLLVFALLVPLLATLAFLGGGTCSVWQWWLAAAIVTALGFVGRDRRDAAWAAVLFAGWMAALWVACGVLTSFGGYDERVCHFPAVRLLAGGWNPLVVRTPERFAAAFGVGLEDMSYLHMLYQM